ncbi:MAG: hypothetical protein QM734_12810 [Cyclobacteriaceae bacterium]
MKTICSILACVLVSTLVSARGTEGATATSSVAVTNATGSTLFKLYYKSVKAGKVKVSIKDNDGSTVFSESMTKIDAFMRPYNFDGLPFGEYTVTVEDESGKTVEAVNYKENKVEKLIHIAKLANEQSKFLLTVASAKLEDVYIYIFDQAGALVHNEIQTINKEFAQVYNLKDLKSFTIEVWDKYGALKKFENF